MKFRLHVVASGLLFAGLGLALRAQDGNKGPEQKESVYAELARVPEKERQKTNPLAKDAEAVAAGEVLFEEHCEECHGNDFLDPDQRRRAQENAGVVKIAGAAAVAIGELHQVARDRRGRERGSVEETVAGFLLPGRHARVPE